MKFPYNPSAPNLGLYPLEVPGVSIFIVGICVHLKNQKPTSHVQIPASDPATPWRLIWLANAHQESLGLERESSVQSVTEFDIKQHSPGCQASLWCSGL